MATANYQLQQQRTTVEGRIRTLINSDLKEICKAYGYQVSGNKSHLQTRCIEILHNIVKRDDRKGFEELNYRVNNHGQAPPPSTPASHVRAPDKSSYTNSSSPYNAQVNSRPPQKALGGLSSLPPSSNLFKTSPFYEFVETVLPFAFLPEYPNNRNTVHATLRLKEEACDRLRQDSTLRLMLYCGADSGLVPSSPPIDVAFPGQIEVKVNGDDVRSNFKGLKNKPGSTKPADITDKVRKHRDYGNMIDIVYALTQKRFVFGVQLVRYVNATALTERIKAGKFIPKQTVLDEMRKANSDEDIAATSVRMSLKDPISTLRITIPVRSDRCSHNQCFDGSMFLQLQEQAPQWTCPVCNRLVVFESLRVDKYFEEILNRTPKSIEKVNIEPDGEWHVIKDEDDSQANGAAARSGPRAPYDDDFDDDDVEVVEIKSEATGNGLANGSFGNATPSYLTGNGKQMNTPPLSSREPSVAQSATSQYPQGTKRPTSSRPSAAMVIDLISSDEDEPPRPAKRQSTSHRRASQANAQPITTGREPFRPPTQILPLDQAATVPSPASPRSPPGQMRVSAPFADQLAAARSRRSERDGLQSPMREGNSSDTGIILT